MFMPKQVNDIPPKARILIVGGPPFAELNLIARNLSSLMNAHLCTTLYVGSLTSLTEYDAHGIFQGEVIVIAYAHEYKYQSTEAREFDLVFYINQPNLGLTENVSTEELHEHLSVHIYYLTLQSIMPGVHVVNNTQRSISTVVDKILDKVTIEWPTIMQKESTVEEYQERHKTNSVLVGTIGHVRTPSGFNNMVIYEAIARLNERQPEVEPPPPAEPPKRAGTNRNAPCYCGSGLKYKKCCLNNKG
jgi:hypothetical protein